jgi:hypothetical protein
VQSLSAHRFRALLSSLVDGAAVGAVLAGRELPPRSRPRALVVSAAVAAVAADQVTADLPAVLRELRTTGAVPPQPPHERRAMLRAGGCALGLGLLLQLVDRPTRAALTRRGAVHPHRWLGAAAGFAHVLLVAPVYWRLGAERAAAETARSARIDAELQEMVAGR